MKIREYLTQLVYSSFSGIVGVSTVGGVQASELLFHGNLLIIRGNYVFQKTS